ncbi:MAG: hypothetical protein M0Q53_18950 [Prolixibacteraceae bacterium]|nr:hypothetical protein [Prolixibacteraceae bacterium]
MVSSRPTGRLYKFSFISHFSRPAGRLYLTIDPFDPFDKLRDRSPQVYLIAQNSLRPFDELREVQAQGSTAKGASSSPIWGLAT